MNKLFPILIQGREAQNTFKAHPEWPRQIPWRIVEPHEARAKKNHDQTLTRLAERGGLAPQELLALLNDVCWSEFMDWPTTEAMEKLLKIETSQMEKIQMNRNIERVIMRLAHDPEFLAAFFSNRQKALTVFEVAELSQTDIDLLLSVSNAHVHNMISVLKERPEVLEQLPEEMQGERTRGTRPDIPAPGSLNRRRRSR